MFQNSSIILTTKPKISSKLVPLQLVTEITFSTYDIQ